MRDSLVIGKSGVRQQIIERSVDKPIWTVIGSEGECGSLCDASTSETDKLSAWTYT